MAQKVYILSGLGVDSSVFETIDFGIYETIHLPWLQPQTKESMHEYALRISALIPENNPTIIGLSFGGIMAITIAQLRPCKKIILLASAKTHHELPAYYSIIGNIGLHHLVPEFLFSKTNFFIHWMFGLTNKNEKQLLATILKNTDPVFRKWAIDNLLHWKNHIIPNNVISIHGDKDRMIPIKNVKVDYIIPNGGHFMTVNQSEIISKLLQSILIN